MRCIGAGYSVVRGGNNLHAFDHLPEAAFDRLFNHKELNDFADLQNGSDGRVVRKIGLNFCGFGIGHHGAQCFH